MTDDKELYDFSRRKLLAGLGTIGAASAGAGLGTSALLWDEETFGSANNPNVLQAGTLDLKVGWQGTYYDWGGTDQTIMNSNGLVDQPSKIVNLTDVKPGDVVELTLEAKPKGNPAFIGTFFQEHMDSDKGYTEPEDMSDGTNDDPSADGTQDGDLDDHMNVVIWYDDGDNLPDELGTFSGLDDADDDGSIDDDDGSGSNTDETKQYVMDVAAVDNATDLVTADGNPGVIYSGKLSGLTGSDFTLNASNSVSSGVASDFSGHCYQAGTVEHIAALAWVPRDIPGVDDNVIQSDRVTFSFGFDAIQCRHNTENGEPIDGNVSAADNES